MICSSVLRCLLSCKPVSAFSTQVMDASTAMCVMCGGVCIAVGQCRRRGRKEERGGGRKRGEKREVKKTLKQRRELLFEGEQFETGFEAGDRGQRQEELFGDGQILLFAVIPFDHLNLFGCGRDFEQRTQLIRVQSALVHRQNSVFDVGVRHATAQHNIHKMEKDEKRKW
jgi:hypothetical protein